MTIATAIPAFRFEMTAWTEDKVMAGLQPIIAALGTMPSAGTLSAMGRGDLSNQIQDRGGFRVWAKKLNASPPRIATKWNDALIEEQLKAVIEAIGVMPSNSELIAMGKRDLAGAVSKSGGFLTWAEKLGANRARSDSDTGWAGEIALSHILQAEGFTVARETAVKAPHDLILNEVLRIDVKTANYAEYGVCKGWFYRIGKLPQADLIALYQADTGDCYFLPWPIVPRTNVTIARDGGKYRNFKNRFDLVRQLCDGRKNRERIFQ